MPPQARPAEPGLPGKAHQPRPTEMGAGPDHSGTDGSPSLASSQTRRGPHEGGDSVRLAPGAVPTSQVVNDLAATIGPQTTDKSCRTCRVRKVKCDRIWPQCQRCRDRGDVCDFGSFVPVAAIPTGALQSVVGNVQAPASESSSAVHQLEVLKLRIAHLEAELANIHAREAEAQSTTLPPATPVAAAPVHPDASRTLPYETTPTTTFSERLSASFRLALGLVGSNADRWQNATIETFLRGLAVQQPELYLPGSTSRASLLGGGAHDVTESSTEWTLARGAMAKMLTIHLVQSFFSSCCAYLPIFLPWHERKQWILGNIDNLDPPARVAVAVFSALGARASPHSAILGVALPTPSLTDCFDEASAAGYRREQACRSLSAQALDLAHTLHIAHELNRANLDALLAIAQMLIFNELIPRRSRTALLVALRQYKDLRAAGYIDPRHDTLEHINLPLLAADAVISAYARKEPIISAHEIEQYFPRSPLPDPKFHSLHTALRACLNEHVDATGAPTHVGIWRALLVLLAWVTAGQRAFASASIPHMGGPPATLTQDIRALWSLLDEAHEGVRSLQEMLIHLDRTPLGCVKDGCTDQHLRFVTRLDKDLLDLFFLTHSLVTEHLGRDSLVGETAHAMYHESDTRIRKALKLTAFYAELYITSRDPHMTYHVFWQLEIFPSWTEFAVQQFGEPGGPNDPALALSATELDWLERGLMTASFYHPCAVPRLHELRQGRARRAPAPTYSGSATSMAVPQRNSDFLAPAPQPPTLSENPSLFTTAPMGVSTNSVNRPAPLGEYAGSVSGQLETYSRANANANGGGAGTYGGGMPTGGDGRQHSDHHVGTSVGIGSGPASTPHQHPQSLGHGSTDTGAGWNRQWGTDDDAQHQSAKTG
ncbi:hypothetical protein JCM3774_001126 [Rhodotorula dairenensis]